METETGNRLPELRLGEDYDSGSGQVVTPSFDTLVQARYDVVQARWRGDVLPEAEARYRRTREVFERVHGTILYEYWTNSTPGGIAVTIKRKPVRLPFLGVGGRAHFFRFTDYLSGRYPDAGELLFAGDALAAICEEVLRGPTQRIALTQVYTASSQLLSSLDAMSAELEVAYANDDPNWPDSPGAEVSGEELERRHDALVRRRAQREEERKTLKQEKEQRLSRAQLGYRRALARAERFYRDGAGQSAQFYYFIGMLVGAAVVALTAFGFTQVLPLLADLWDLDLPKRDTAAGFAAAAAGSLGACVSVMWRMTAGTFGEDAVFGADNLARLGAFRPFLGSMFGLILYVALQADVISDTYIPANPSWYFYIFLGFLAGFSERLVPDFLGDSEKGLSRRNGPAATKHESLVEEPPATDEAPQAPVITA
jgi:hypothetical protein